jgi:hypothetical protein
MHVHFTSTILHSHALLVPQAYCEANLDRLEVYWSRALNLVCEVAFTLFYLFLLFYFLR